jgi:predicted permease
MNEFRSAVRLLVRHLGFSLAVAGALAVGIASVVTAFNVFDAILLRPLPVPRPGELVRLVQTFPPLPKQSSFTEDYFEALGKAQSLASVFGAIDERAVMNEGGRAEEVRVSLVTPGFFEALGATARLGRTLGALDETDDGESPPAVLSYGFWKARFSADPSVVGRKISLQHHAFTVVGVSQEGFNGISADTAPALRVPLRCLPLISERAPAAKARYSPLEIGARLRDGASRQQGQAECSLIWRRVTRAFIETLPALRREPRAVEAELSTGVELEGLERGVSVLRERIGWPLRLLFGATIILQLIVGINVAGLLLARGAARRAEMAARIALGAARRQLVKQLLVESCLLTGIGSICGAVLAAVLSPLSLRLMPPIRDVLTNRLALAVDLRFHWRVLVVSIATAAATALLTGLAPAIAGSRLDPGAALGSARVSPRSRGRGLLLALEIGLCTFLLAFAGLLIQSFERLHNVDTGFDAAHVVTFSIDPELSGYTPDRIRAYQRELLSRVRALGSVDFVATAMRGVLRDSGVKTSVAPSGMPVTAADQFKTSFNNVSQDYFATLGMKLVLGRGFKTDDYIAGKPVKVVVNEAFARRYFPHTSPLMRFFGRGDQVAAKDFEVIGVVNDSKYRSLREPTVPTFFAPASSSDFVLCVRTRGRPDAIIKPVERLVAAIDADVPVLEARTLADEVDDSAAPESAAATLGATLAGGATLLVAIGVLALFQTLAMQKRQEIGIRVALGASPADILRMFFAMALTNAGAGVVGGLAAFWLIRPVVQTWLYHVKAADPVAPAAACAVMLLVSSAAAVAPGWGAKSISPSVALRHDC